LGGGLKGEDSFRQITGSTLKYRLDEREAKRHTGDTRPSRANSKFPPFFDFICKTHTINILFLKNHLLSNSSGTNSCN
jgi:hypothetical protein